MLPRDEAGKRQGRYTPNLLVDLTKLRWRAAKRVPGGRSARRSVLRACAGGFAQRAVGA